MTIIIHTASSSRRRKHKWASAEHKKQALEYEAWQRKQGVHPDQLKAKSKPKATVKPLSPRPAPHYRETTHYPSLSSAVSRDACSKRPSVMDHLDQEAPEVVQAILRKASSIAPAYNKGAYQYITPETDLTTLGRKA